MVKLLPKTEEKSERSNPKKWMLASMISKFSLVSAMLLLWKWQAHGRIAQGRATIRKFVALSFRDKCWGGKTCCLYSIPNFHIILFSWKWEWTPRREREGWGAHWMGSAASHPPFNSPLGWGRPVPHAFPGARVATVSASLCDSSAFDEMDKF